MPELPEVETVANQLNGVLSGKTFLSVKVLREKSAQSDLSSLVGKRIKKISRLAKQIRMDIRGEDKILLIHLKMTGQLVYQESEGRSSKSRKRIVGGHPTKDWVSDLPSSHTRIIARFTDGSILFFNDQRVFGWWKLVSEDDLRKIADNLPPDVVDKEFDSNYLEAILERSRRAVKLVILDQKKMGGMGNIYANDSLWIARIDPKKPANELNNKEIKKLCSAMKQVLSEGISSGGASISDFVHVSGSGGGYQEIMRVYEKEGQRCSRHGCDGIIKKEKIGGRGTYYCPICQV